MDIFYPIPIIQTHTLRLTQGCYTRYMPFTSLGQIDECPPDPILGLTKDINQDPRENLVNATVGVIKTDANQIFVPQIVKQVWSSVSAEPVGYLSPSNQFEWLGDTGFIESAIRLILGKNTSPETVAALGTVGGTGAIYLMLSSYRHLLDQPQILISSPSWPNHYNIASDLGYQLHTYPHVKDHQYNFKVHLKAIQELPQQSLVLFHAGRTHNPTGTNPSPAEWQRLAGAMVDKIALFDAAYLGLDADFDTDCFSFRYFLEQGIPTVVAVSFAKNAGLYNQRPGLLLLPQKNHSAQQTVQRFFNAQARLIYSTPPAQGQRVLGHILSQPHQHRKWFQELNQVNQLIKNRRQLLADLVPEVTFVSDQSGLFSQLPVSKTQVLAMRKNHGVYLTDSGRINLGGIPTESIQLVATALVNVLG